MDNAIVVREPQPGDDVIAPAQKRYRLTARAEMHGALREPGYVFTLPLDADGKEIAGPHRSVVASNHGAQIADHMGAAQGLVDVPLYEEVKDDPATPQDESVAVEISPELEAAHARIAALEAELADKDRQLGEAHARLAAVDGALKAPALAADPDAPLYDPAANMG